MKFSKKQEKEVLKVYEAFFHSYLNGDVKNYASYLDDDFHFVGTVAEEEFLNKKDAVKFFEKTADQFSGKLELRNREIKAEAFNESHESFVLIIERNDGYFLNEGKWSFYSVFRMSTLFIKRKTGWKLIHQHISMPDSKAEEGQTIAIEQIKTENLQLRDAVKRRTIELENKNHELEIEASLERVRAIALGMSRSEELLNVCEILFKELKTLGFDELRNTMINIHNDEEKTFLNYDYSDKLGKTITPLYYNINPVIAKQIKQIRKSKDAFSETSFKGDELKEWKRFRKKRGEPDDPRLKNTNALYYYFYSIGTGSIGISTFGFITKEKLKLLKRFRNVFEFAYRRYSDVALAEAQAKDAQIELSLERVRARSMAMHNSDELVDASVVLFNELKSLGIESIRTGVAIFDELNKSVEIWSSQLIKENRNKIIGIVPFKTHPFFEKCYRAWKRKAPYYFYEISGSEVKKYYKATSSVLSYPLKKKFNSKEMFYTFFFPEGSLNVVSEKNLSEDECSLMVRFANVFGLIYRRFLDLQKAEAQAKEGQIELALERVRARTMAMQRSDELEETSQILFQQFKELGEHPERITIGTINEEERQIELWVTVEGDKNRMVKVSIDEPNVSKKIYLAWKEQKKSILIDLTGKRLSEYLAYRKSFGNTQGNSDFLKDRMIAYVAFFSKGIISISTSELKSRESIQLLERFAGVFDLTYTRFLDLQKAEEQAREAQIEVALERVRSRTMAMHSSDELQEAAVLLFQQIRDLGVNTGSCGYIIWDNEKKDASVWMSSPEGSIQEPFKLPHTKSKIYKEIFTAKESGKDFFVKEVRGKELRNHFDYLTSVPGIGEKIKQLRKSGYKFPETIVYNIAFFKQGYLSFHTHELSSEAHDIFRRFANVFEQTYTRFLDLQKAEAQTREGQIQLALERVRAKAMAMQKSDQLLEVSLELYNQFKQLDSTVRGLTINIVNEKERVFEVSFGMFNQSFKLSIDEQIVMSKAYKYWKSGKKSLILELSRKDLIKFNKIRNTAVGSEIFPLEYKSGFKLIMYMAFFSSGMLIVGMEEHRPEETTDILQRFASVFDLTYTRFLDLKKAEAQARESQIEASLEKIRSRSLAMHNAEELGEVISVIVEKLKELDFSVDDGVALITHIEGSKDLLEWMANPGFPSAIKFYLPYFEHPVLSDLWKAKNEGAEFAVKRYTAKENKSFLTHIFKHSDFKHTPQPIKDYCLTADTYATSIAFQKNTAIFINDYSGKTLTQQEIDILKRFSKVFEQAYIRFLDLQKAEAQARESQIEAALERVRSRTMGMQKSDELKDVIQVIYEQFVHLNIIIDHAGIIMDYKERDDMNIWVSDHRGNLSQVTIPYFDSEHWNRFNEAKENGKDFFAVNLNFIEKNTFYKKLFKFIPGLPEEAKDFYFSCPGLAISTVLLDNVSLYIENFSGLSYSDEENATLMRFGKVFQQTYTRFLDLQKAEAQTRESQIEASLEKVRGKAMAMHNSIDLTDAAGMVFTELNILGIKPIRSGFVLLSKDTRIAKLYPATSFDNKNTVSFTGEFEFTGHPVYEKQYQSWLDKENYFPVLEGDLLKSYYKILAKGLSVPYKNFPTKNKKQFGTFLPFSGGFLFTWSDDPFTENEISILDRFKSILDLTIRRYVDLKNAEEQSRESQIEASLERVRSKAMAMQNSNDIGLAVATIFEELEKLNLETLRCGIGIINKEKKSADVWSTTKSEGGTAVQVSGDEPIAHPLLEGAYEAWLNQRDFSYLLEGKDLNEYYKSLTKTNFKLPDSESKVIEAEGLKQYYYVTAFPTGNLYAFRETEFPEEAKIVMKRFADVINFTYTRFNDLKLSEAQAKEAQIELSLERVRAKTMAMHNSKDVGETVTVMFEELLNLGIEKTIRCGIIIINKSKQMEVWNASFDANGKVVLIIGRLDMTIHPSLQGVYNAWELKLPSFSYEFAGEDLKDYFRAINNSPDYPLQIDIDLLPPKYFNTEFFFTEGAIFSFTRSPLPSDKEQIFIRFASVIGQTYRRYLDLQKAEAQARESTIEASLERVRSRTLAMQKSDELAETAAVVFKQLISLGIEPNRLYIGIIKDESDEIEFWITDEDGTRVSNQFSGSRDKNASIKKMYDGWKSQQKSITIDMKGKELQEYFHHLSDELHVPFKQGLSQKRRVQSIAYFSHGFIGIASPELQPEETIFLLERFAAVFNLTYARFNDLKVAEHNAEQANLDLIKLQTEKKRAEDALTELRATQAQLIQSEKMASLGELTAGIAHEIQNPLNFVNNFSEVNTELIEELNEELGKGNFEDAIAIAKDIKENEEKIKHHGKRAEGIVKGMLQHSRSSSGVKEPTDINALADEYLRLAYHGLRAKDKSFNAKMETNYDDNIGKINIIPQDIGRVILNLITNAFYVVDEKRNPELKIMNRQLQ
ncbi:MAG: nuclear transport factor 2 family protein [Ignavibacteria bacterium]|nr:nuclear transport factor 2 family protein [Ignavibacteria bacterium]